MSPGIMSLLLITCLAIGSHAQAPNIIFIMVDDMGWNDISYRPSTEIQTPTLTKLALVDGVRLENYYTGPSCGPTRSQFLSGKYTIHLGLQASNLPGCTNMALNSTLDTVADKLKAEGYITHLIGKWHAGFNTIDHYPTYRGFDTFRGFLLSHSSNHFTRKSRYDGTNYYDYHNDNGTNIVSPYTGDDLDASGGKLYSTTAFTDRAVELIGQHDNHESMFMYLSYQAPHTPVETEKVDPYDSLYSSIPISDRKSMASMVSSIDAGVEKVVQALKDNNMYENSYIIFTSDNGGSNQAGASTWPLRGAKGSYYEGGIRNIGFVHSPLLNVGNNTQRTALIHVTDWMPTFMHIARGHDVDGQALGIDGVDQFTTITSGTASRDKILHTIERRQTNGRNKYDTSIPSAMVKEYNGKKYKILTGRMTGSVKYPNPSADYDEWEYVRTTKNQTAESGVRLYNLSDDPAEDYDLSSSSSSDIVTILSDLTAELRAYEQGAVDPIIPVYYGSGTANEECDPAKHGGAFSYYQ